MSDWIASLVGSVDARHAAALWRAGAAGVLGLALSALHVRFKDKGAAGVIDLLRWLALLWTLETLRPVILTGRLEALTLTVEGLFAWLAVRAALHGVYAEIFLGRVRRVTVNPIVLNLVSFAAMGMVVLWVLNTAFDVRLGALLTSSAILTAVVGFSMQDTIGSLFSGLLIHMEKPFKPGNWIKTGDQEGKVVEITWRYTKLRTLDETLVLIPNNAIAKERLTNLTEPIPQVRLMQDVPAPLGIPPVKVRSALENALRKCSHVAARPAPSVRLCEITPSRAVYRLAYFIEDYAQSRAARNEALSAVWYEFLRQGIDFPAERREIIQSKTCSVNAGQTAEMLAQAPLFSGMQPAELELLVSCSANRSYPDGAVIVQKGQRGDTLFLIVSGLVSVRLGDRELSRLGPGEVFGEMALLTGEPRQADVVAMERTVCLEVDREAFRVVLEKNPVLSNNVKSVFKARDGERRAKPSQTRKNGDEGLFEVFRKLFW